MHGSIRACCRRLAPALGVALALTVVPCRIVLHGCVPGIDVASAHAAKGGNGGGNNGNGNGNGNGGGNGSNGNSGGGNSGNGNGGNGGGNNGNGDGSGGNSGKGQGDKGEGGKGASHVSPTTGDKVEIDGGNITVQHPDGMTEEIENGRFRMLDALGRTIIERRATPADMRRLKAL